MTIDELLNLIDKKILSEIVQYCELNNNSPVDFINSILKNNIIVEKYGDKPPMFNNDIVKNKIPDDIIKTDIIIENETFVTETIINEPINSKRKLKIK